MPKALSVNECIYCGFNDDFNELTDEHIVPYGLSGDYILPKSSCKNCAKETGRIEQFVLKENLGAPRELLGLKTRRKKNRTGIRKLYDPVTNQPVEVPIQFSLPHLLIPYAPFLPRLLTLEAKEEKHNKHNCKHIPIGSKWLPNGLFGKHSETIKVDYVKYARMLAKIAHSWGVYNCGINYFEPLLTDFILSGTGDVSEFIGAVDENVITKNLHEISLRRQKIADTTYLIAEIQLFSFFSAPKAIVVVGKFFAKN